MFHYTQKSKFTWGNRFIASLIILTFGFSSVIPPRASIAQMIPNTVLNLPAPGTLVPMSAQFQPVMMRGINIDPNNPLQFDFIMDQGDTDLEADAFREEANSLIKYFLASLAVPEDEMWVNLSPYEENRIIPGIFGTTEMGRDLLAQDYMLKQLSASLMYPEDELGKKFWDRVHSQAQERFGSTEIPMNTFNKIWILPEKAVVYEHAKGAFIVESHLKVMLEEDYIALDANQKSDKHGLGDIEQDDLEVISGVQADIVREVLIPEIEKEVNSGKTFANLRQIFNTMILATWYKTNLKDSFLGQKYVNQGVTGGVDVADKTVNQKIYNQYVEAFKKGVYNYIKEEYDPTTQNIIPRKYFSGGIDFDDKAMTASFESVAEFDPAELRDVDRLVAVRAGTDLEGVDGERVSHGEFDEALLVGGINDIDALLGGILTKMGRDSSVEYQLSYGGFFDRSTNGSIRSLKEIAKNLGDYIRKNYDGSEEELLKRKFTVDGQYGRGELILKLEDVEEDRASLAEGDLLPFESIIRRQLRTSLLEPIFTMDQLLLNAPNLYQGVDQGAIQAVLAKMEKQGELELESGVWLRSLNGSLAEGVIQDINELSLPEVGQPEEESRFRRTAELQLSMRDLTFNELDYLLRYYRTRGEQKGDINVTELIDGVIQLKQGEEDAAQLLIQPKSTSQMYAYLINNFTTLFGDRYAVKGDASDEEFYMTFTGIGQATPRSFEFRMRKNPATRGYVLNWIINDNYESSLRSVPVLDVLAVPSQGIVAFAVEDALIDDIADGLSGILEVDEETGVLIGDRSVFGVGVNVMMESTLREESEALTGLIEFVDHAMLSEKQNDQSYQVGLVNRFFDENDKLHNDRISRVDSDVLRGALVDVIGKVISENQGLSVRTFENALYAATRVDRYVYPNGIERGSEGAEETLYNWLSLVVIAEISEAFVLPKAFSERSDEVEVDEKSAKTGRELFEKFRPYAESIDDLTFGEVRDVMGARDTFVLAALHFIRRPERQRLDAINSLNLIAGDLNISELSGEGVLRYLSNRIQARERINLMTLLSVYRAVLKQVEKEARDAPERDSAQLVERVRELLRKQFSTEGFTGQYNNYLIASIAALAFSIALPNIASVETDDTAASPEAVQVIKAPDFSGHSFYRYTVNPGEYLQMIATKMGSSIKNIIAVNRNISDDGEIIRGQSITIPISEVRAKGLDLVGKGLDPIDGNVTVGDTTYILVDGHVLSVFKSESESGEAKNEGDHAQVVQQMKVIEAMIEKAQQEFDTSSESVREEIRARFGRGEINIMRSPVGGTIKQLREDLQRNIDRDTVTSDYYAGLISDIREIQDLPYVSGLGEIGSDPMIDILELRKEFRTLAMLMGGVKISPQEFIGEAEEDSAQYGGIDMNPANLNLQTESQGEGFQMPQFNQPFDNIEIQGILPVIINITPITNLPLLLGVNEDVPVQQISLK